MFTITVETEFNAAHQLTLPDGTVEDLHEHCFKVRVAVSAETLDKMDVVMDFHLLKQQLDDILAPLVGQNLEEVEYFVDAGINASAETLVRYIYEKLSLVMEGGVADNVALEFAEVMEHPDCWAKYAK